MTTVVRALNSLKSIAGKPARFIVSAVLAVPLLAQGDVVVLRDTVDGHVNIRIAPEAGTQVIGQLGRSEHLPYVQAHGPRWREVRLGDDRTGFISQTWTEVIPDPPDQSEAALHQFLGHCRYNRSVCGFRLEITPKDMDDPVVAQAPDEVTERKVVGPTVVDTPEEIVEDEVVDEPIVAEAS